MCIRLTRFLKLRKSEYQPNTIVLSGYLIEWIPCSGYNRCLLVPGIGAQGDNLGEDSKYGMNKDSGLVLNSSRAIIYASNGDDFAETTGAEALRVQLQMHEKAGII